jgi:hypothetical protein
VFKPNDGHFKPLSQEHAPIESCNPIGEKIQLVPKHFHLFQDEIESTCPKE